MKKVLSRSFKILGAVLVLFLLAFFLLTYFMSPERIKPMLISTVQEKYQRTLALGDMRWKLFPRVGLSLSDVSLSNNPTFGDGVFAAFKNITIYVSTMDLLRGHVDVKTMTLADAQANLKTNKEGVKNWQDLMQVAAVDATATPEGAKRAPVQEKSGYRDFSFNIESIEIKDAAFSYQDEKTGEAYEITKLNFNSKNVAFNQAFPVDLSFDLSSNAPQLKTRVSATATMRVNSKDNHYDLSSVVMEGKVSIPSLLANGLTVTNITAPLKAEAGVISLSPIEAKFYGGTLGGGLKINSNEDPAGIVVNYDIKNAQMGPFLRDMGSDENITGALTVKGDLRFRSYPEKKQLMSSLNGGANIYIGNGTLHGLDLAYWNAVGHMMLNPEAGLQAGRNTGQTRFTKGSGSFTLDKGRIYNRDFVMYGNDIYGAGAGTVDLVNEWVDYRFNLQGLTPQGQPAGNIIPLQIKGSLDNPKVGLDQQIVQKQLIEGIGKEVLKNIFSR